MDLHERQAIPQQFLDAYYTQAHICYALDIDEPAFWGLYVTGKIPRGYSLMALTGEPLLVWPRDVLDQWTRDGRPAEPGAVELENRVLHDLMEAYESEGIHFPSVAPHELN